MARQIKGAPAMAAAALALSVGACGHNPFTTASWGTRHSLSERECMARAMYFESNRSSEEGMSAVGTVVMNRLQSGRYPKTVCGVVGQHNQFAQGALSKPVSGRSWALALAKADAVLAGERHSRVASAMHFHTAGYTFPYRNMAYVVAAGGNVFYEKKPAGTFSPVHPQVLVAQAEGEPRRPSEAIVLARVEQSAPVIRRPEPRLAGLVDREAPREMRVPQPVRSPVARRDEEADAPRAPTRPERIRLAHLDDSAMPKAMRLRSDAATPGPMGGMPLAYRAVSKPEPAKPAPRGESAKPNAGSPPRLGSRPDTAKSSTPKAAPTKHGAAMSGATQPVAAKLSPAKPSGATPSVAKPSGAKPSGGEPLPYREAKARPSTQDASKLGWKRGPEPALAASDKAKKRL